MTTEKTQYEAQQAIYQASQAMRRGDRTQARRWASLAAQINPADEQPWLILAALAAPQASIAYLKKALELNPNSEAARKGMHWAVERLRQQTEKVVKQPEQAAPTQAAKPQTLSTTATAEAPAAARPPAQARAAQQPSPTVPVRRRLAAAPAEATRPVVVRRKRKEFPIWAAAVFVVVFIGLCLAGLSGAWIVMAGSDSAGKALSALLYATNTPVPSLTAVPKPTSTHTQIPTETQTPLPTATTAPTATETALPTDTLTPEPTATETLEPTLEPSPTDLPVEVFIPTDTSEPDPYIPPSGGSSDERWIDVDLTNQMTYAYEGDVLVNSFLVSTGTWEHPTVTGQFHIYVKYLYADMTGPGYYLTDVPYVMYFYEGYGLHGTYWHSNFGTPMSYGCINLRTDNAGWLFNWADVGTLVNIHY